jgi:serine/threonine-protein kinase RIO1
MHLDAEVSNYHKSNIENAINPSMALKFYKLPANEEEKRDILTSIKKNFQGSSNTGRAMVFFADSKETAPDIEPIAVSNIDKQFSVTADQIQRNICYSHKMNPEIMGLKISGNLGNSNDLGQSMEIFNKSTIQPAQRDIEQIINSFLYINKIPVTFRLNEMNLYAPKEPTL